MKNQKLLYDKNLLMLHKPLLSILGNWLKSLIGGKFIDDKLGILLLNLLKREVKSDYSGQNRIKRIASSLEGISDHANIVSIMEDLDETESKYWVSLKEYADSFNCYTLSMSHSLEYIAGIESCFRSMGLLPKLENTLYLVKDCRYFDYSLIYENGIKHDVSCLIENFINSKEYNIDCYKRAHSDTTNFINSYTSIAVQLANNLTNVHFLMLSMKINQQY